MDLITTPGNSNNFSQMATCAVSVPESSDDPLRGNDCTSPELLLTTTTDYTCGSRGVSAPTSEKSASCYGRQFKRQQNMPRETLVPICHAKCRCPLSVQNIPRKVPFSVYRPRTTTRETSFPIFCAKLTMTSAISRVPHTWPFGSNFHVGRFE